MVEKELTKLIKKLTCSWLPALCTFKGNMKCQDKTICLRKGLKEFIYELRKCCCFCLEMPNKLKKVYELEGLVCDLHAHFTAASGSTLAISKSKATELLASTIFDYEPNSRYF